MLFAYTYVPHQMEKMQEYIDFIFYEVWCKAPIGLEFHPDLFNDKPELHEIMSGFGFSGQAPARGKAFYNDVKEIYVLFASLSSQEIEQFTQWYQGNNDIEKVCANDPEAKLARYVDIPVEHTELRDHLKSFFNDLYSQALLGLAAFKETVGDINDHYKTFVKINKAGKCPFCGINDTLGEYHNKRDAYDHYLPKALYPFNSINFKNLVPACHHCNSSYKTSKDPAHQVKDPAGTPQRRKFFYPYQSNTQKVEITVNVAHTDIDKLRPDDISFEFGPTTLAEELATWRDVYSIEERYTAKLLGENNGRYWIEQALQEWPSIGRDTSELLEELALQADKRPFADCNFLKYAYLQGCYWAGMFSLINADAAVLVEAQSG